MHWQRPQWLLSLQNVEHFSIVESPVCSELHALGGGGDTMGGDGGGGGGGGDAMGGAGGLHIAQLLHWQRMQ